MSKIPSKLCKISELVIFRSTVAENEISSWVTNSVEKKENRKYVYRYVQIIFGVVFAPCKAF